MPKPLKINKNGRFLNAYKRGNSKVSPVLVTYVVKNRRGKNAVGITASKKVGGAVQRNRAKRLISAAYRECSLNLLEGYDIVFVARAKTCEVKMQDVKKSMIQHLTALKLIP